MGTFAAIPGGISGLCALMGTLVASDIFPRGTGQNLQGRIIMKNQNNNPGVSNPDAGNRLLPVKVHPGTSRNEITGFTGGVLQVKIAAPPEKGKANKELTDFLSRRLAVKKSSISITKGETGRNKLIAIKGLSPEEIIKRLSA
jgi:uncharacterized protein (TIGR00251 family)